MKKKISLTLKNLSNVNSNELPFMSTIVKKKKPEKVRLARDSNP